MYPSLHQLRRRATQLAIRRAIAAIAPFPADIQRPVVRSCVELAGHIPLLRRKVRENMRLGLGYEAPANAEARYFRHLGWYLSNALSTFHHGLTEQLMQEVRFDSSLRLLDSAIAAGRGVVLASPHWSGHELLAAVLGRRHPMTMLVREVPSAERMTRKLKWYKALGVETVLRPVGASSFKEAVIYLKILKRGRLLGITPDILAGPEGQVEASIFRRRARFHGGAFALAISAGAPMIRPTLHREAAKRVVVSFELWEPIQAHDPGFAIQAAVQDWCHWFENSLKEAPENWLFWLDKKWSRFLRTTPRDIR